MLHRWGEAIDTRRQHRLHRRRNLNRVQRLGEAQCASVSKYHARLDERADALLEEKGVSLRPLREEMLERLQLASRAHQGVEERRGAFRGERIDSDLRVVALAAPAMLILR